MVTAEKAKVPNITRHEIEEFLELDKRRKELEREARQLKARQDRIEADLLVFTRAKSKKPGSAVTRSGFTLSIFEGRPYVNWKNEFVDVAGNDKAELLIKAAKGREKIQVTPN